MIRQLDALTRVIPVRYAVDRELCVHYAKQFTQLRAAGTPIGANDLWVDCYALALSATQVNEQHQRVQARRWPTVGELGYLSGKPFKACRRLARLESCSARRHRNSPPRPPPDPAPAR